MYVPQKKNLISQLSKLIKILRANFTYSHAFFVDWPFFEEFALKIKWGLHAKQGVKKYNPLINVIFGQKKARHFVGKKYWTGK